MLFKKIIGINNTYDRKYGVAFLIDFAVIFSLVAFVNMFIELGIVLPSLAPFTSIPYVLIVVYFIRELIQAAYIQLILIRRRYTVSVSDTPIDTKIAKSAISNELKKVDDTRLLKEGSFWRLYDAIFDFYRKTKQGKFKSKQAYYTVFEAKLHRTVPHLIFDSKDAKNRQFRYLYLQSQRLSLEGNFDDHFEAYAPKYYQIDALSFITPEVMQAMIEMKGFDIEFVEDSLLCYAPLLSKKDLKNFQDKCLNLHKNVNDNISSYKENRLKGRSRSHRVTSFGKRLLNNPARYVPMLVLSGLGSGVVVYLSASYSWELLMENISVSVLFLFGYSIVQIVKTIRRNHKLESKFRKAHSI